ENGMQLDLAADGVKGLEQALATPYDIIILDIMLPQMDGWSVLAGLRQAGKQTPVLFLTARDAVRDRVKGLELGADDYLVKPFAFSELLARIHSILRRAQGHSPDILHVADLEIDLLRDRALRAGKPLELTPKEFSLLALLARHTGEILSRRQLAKQVWDMEVLSDSNVVDVHVRRLRAKADDPFANKLIHTVRGAGYVLEARP
ncbi:MAG TPA: winged helix-turn-helix domain-containing protein, partial [Gemmataceae bacterium]|nr:winged helix-turn-helix domain-containing protein [Gemmataceae bacterium]